jgi:hypothetical protein
MAELKHLMLALLDDWGCLLETTLYLNALAHFLGRDGQVEVACDGRRIGEQRVTLLTDDIAFTVTSLRRSSGMEAHLRRLLRHTSLRAIAWINLDQTSVSFTRIGADSV